MPLAVTDGWGVGKLLRVVCVLLVAMLFACSHGARAQSRSKEFSDPYHDGYVLALWGNNYDQDQLDAIMKRIKATGARHLEVVVMGCQTDIYSTDVGACNLRPYAYSMSIVDRAIAAGFDTTILPLMGGSHFEWRGKFEPKDVDEWFKNYTTWIVSMAREAQARKMREFVVGSEFSTLQKHEKKWREVIAEVRKVFRGPVIYTANWDALSIAFWDAVDAIGVSAYFPLTNEPDPSQDSLDLAWRKRRAELLALSAKHARPVHVTEVGYVSGNSAAATPFHTPPDDPKNEPLQARCFEAFRRAWKDEKRLVRANVWATHGPESNGVDVNADPVGRPAEAVLRAFFDERAALR
jgi:hypothetical protein